MREAPRSNAAVIHSTFRGRVKWGGASCVDTNALKETEVTTCLSNHWRDRLHTYFSGHSGSSIFLRTFAVCSP
ncbi:hypothetical protein UC8_25900 [Roseimaritima ulvae]|uniref:Uncharacterized protein n=1 Tax=Roseimaritima ulvae TaxID=980254 RepID=A0A5B9QT34_9BACT|nr:hypothetical protein UC8_25900 [Roseimaritima ulvae]